MSTFESELVCRVTQVEADSDIVDGIHHRIQCDPCEFVLAGKSAQIMYEKQSDYFLGKKVAELINAATAHLTDPDSMNAAPVQAADPGGHFVLVDKV